MRPLIARPFRQDHAATPTRPGAGPRVGRSRVPLHRRLLFARRAAAYWALVAILAFATAGTVARATSRAAAAEHRWGSTRPVVVAVRDLRPGPVPRVGAVRIEARPLASLPARAVRRLPAGAALSGPVARGEVITTARLAASPEALPGGRVAMAVPRGEAPIAVQPGQRVEVFATFDASLAGIGRPTSTRVVRRAVVLRVRGAVLTLAVTGPEATGLATATALGTVTVARVG
jgi:Flp pilus assembly protein CpaB